MDSTLKKVSYSVFLDPTQNESDYFAYKIMQKWAKQQKQFAQDPSAAVQLHNQIHIHKDIYLSGLYLHQLKPELAKSLASGLSKDTINNKTLNSILEAHQVIEHPCPSSASVDTGDTDRLAMAIEKLDSFCTANSNISSQPQFVGQGFIQTVADSIAPQQVAMEAELSALRSLVEQQTQLIETLIAESKITVTTEQTASVTEIKPSPGVNERMSNVKKVKKKGIF
ncbi:hypothetical protein [Vibrio agarivorans]|uniref:hypothetical protein n=1 Tax=Vibrio agarivorans TaxID=153622 RepID=UPI0022320812|nr:hypothetical protein [Vibrio agarivorans]